MKRLVAAAAVVFAVTVAPAQAATTHDVGIVNFAFRNGACPLPAGNNVATIRSGDTVRWTNCDTAVHTVTADNDSFDSGELPLGGAFTRTFNSAGFFNYHCEKHASMTGRVVVEPAPASTTRPTAPPATTTTAPNRTTTTTAPSTTTTTTTTQPTTTSTSLEATTTTAEQMAIASEEGDGANGALVGLLVVGIAGVVGAGVYAVRRMRAV